MSARSRKQNAQTKRNQKRKRKEQARGKKKANSQRRVDRAFSGHKHQQQLKNLTPIAWQGEDELDVAVFDESAFNRLDSDFRPLVDSVRQAFDLLAMDKAQQAMDAVATISRNSPMSDWRQLIRGLKHWIENDCTAAERVWSRLDEQRRPARIACALMLAHRDDLAELTSTVDPASDQPLPQSKAAANDPDDAALAGEPVKKTPASVTAAVPLDSAIIKAAKVVRRTRIDRSAIRIARIAIERHTVNEDQEPGLTILPEMISWIGSFARDFRHTEPQLVQALELAALDRASRQVYVDIFRLACSHLRGPVHDRKNNLRAYFFELEFNGSESKVQACLKKYRDIDLPVNSALSEPLRNALLSSLAMIGAMQEIELLRVLDGPFTTFGPEIDDPAAKQRIQKQFNAAISAYPLNRTAHLTYTGWLKQEIAEATDKKAVELLDSELVNAMQCWADSIESDVKPRQFLTEALLDSEQLEQAEPHIRWLTNAQPGDLQVQALPWKLQFLKAMQLSRRKAGLTEVPAVLESVKVQWPNWLTTNWLPYFSAALMLRCGDLEAYEECRKSICAASGTARDSLADACMMLGAAQKMKVSAAELKPLRAPVDNAVSDLTRLETTDLIAACRFFWDMHRARIFYPAFRMHGGKIGKELLHRIGIDATLVTDNLDNMDFLESVLWMSEKRFWQNRYEISIVSSLYNLLGEHVFITAAIVNTMVQIPYLRDTPNYRDAVVLLKKSIRTESRPYYRQWLSSLVDDFEARLNESERYALDQYRGIDTDDCQCPECTARRARQSARVNEPRVSVPQLDQRFEQTELF